MAFDVIYVRCSPEMKAAIQAEVDALNAHREPLAPEYSLSSFVLNCIEQCIASERNARKARRK